MKKLIETTTELTRCGAVAMQLNRPKFRRQRGATAIEYAVIAAVVAIALFAVFGPSQEGEGFRGLLQSLFESVKNAVSEEG